MLFLIFSLSQVSNPIVINTSIADPHIHIFDNVAYMYAGRDLSRHSKSFMMPDWSVWMSTDLVTWQKKTTILPGQTYLGNSSEDCWATDVVRMEREPDNFFYAFFFSHGGKSTGVMIASNPLLSDAKDALGRPLVSSANYPNENGVYVTNLTQGARDPTILADDDGNNYLCLGLRDDSGDYVIAKLGENLTVLDTDLKAVQVLPSADGSTLPTNDKPTLHKHNGTYYLSAGSFYATSNNPTGPYLFKGSSSQRIGYHDYGDTTQGHGRYFDWRGQSFHVWCEFFSQNNTANSAPTPKGEYYRWRDSWMTYTHYTAEGEMIDDVRFLDSYGIEGVGHYKSDWNIEAEWFMFADAIEKTQLGGSNFAVIFLNASSLLGFPLVESQPESGTLSLLLSSVTGEGTMRAYGGKDGKSLFASCAIKLGSKSSSCPFRLDQGEDPNGTIIFRYTASRSGCMALDSWSLQSNEKMGGRTVYPD